MPTEDSQSQAALFSSKRKAKENPLREPERVRSRRAYLEVLVDRISSESVDVMTEESFVFIEDHKR